MNDRRELELLQASLRTQIRDYTIRINSWCSPEETDTLKEQAQDLLTLIKMLEKVGEELENDAEEEGE